MSRLGRRIASVERAAGGSGRIFFTTVPDMAEDQHAAFLAAERERRGIGPNDVHFVTVYEQEPER